MSASTRQIVPVILTGLDAGGTEPTLVAKGGLLRLENAVWKRKGAIDKRCGLATLGGAPAGQAHLATLGDKVITLGDSLQLWSDAAGAWHVVGTLGLYDYSISPKSAIPGDPTGAEVAIIGNTLLLVYSWYAPGPVGVVNPYPRYSICAAAKTYSLDDGALLDSRDFGAIWPGFSGNVQPWSLKTVVRNGQFEIFRLGGSTLQRSVVSAAGAIGSLANVHVFARAVKIDDAARWDLCLLGSNVAMVAYADEFNDVTIGMISAADAVTEVVHPATTARTVGCCQLRAGVGVLAYYDAGTSPTTIKAVGYSSAGAIVVTEATLENNGGSGHTIYAPKSLVGVATSDTSAAVYWTDASAASIPTVASHDYRVLKNTFTDSSGTGAAGTVATFKEGVLVAAKPMVSGSQHYLPVTPDVPATRGQPGAVVLNSTGRVVAAYLVGYQYASEFFQPSAPIAGSLRWCAIDYGTWMGTTRTPRWDQPAPSGANAGFGASLITLVEGLADCKAIDTGTTLLIPGALPREFDGVQVVEHGFLTYPFKCALELVVAGGSLGVGTYGYTWVFEWFDGAKRRYLSAPSPVASAVTDGSHKRVNVFLPPKLTLTEKTGWRAVLYRTECNGSTFYRRAVVESSDWSATSYVADDAADTTITAEEQLYTGGGSLQNMQIAPFRVGCMHMGRALVVPIEDPQLVWQSKQLRTTQGIHWGAEWLSCRLEAGGALTALQSFFGRLLAFSSGRTLVLEGAPRNDAAGGSGFSDYLLADGVGCLNHRKLAPVPDGVAFLSSTGIKAIDKSLQVQAIGEGVKYHTDSLTIVRAVQRASSHAAIFLTSSGLALEVNTEQGTWSTHTAHTALDGAYAGGKLHVLDTSRVLKRELAGSYVDGAAAIALLLETGWIHLSGLGAQARLKRAFVFGYALDHAHTLNVSWQYNGDPVWRDTQTLSAAAIKEFDYSTFFGAGLADTYRNQAYVVQAVPGIQKLTSCRLRISDSGSTAASFSIVGISFEVDPKPGSWRPGANRMTT